MESREISQAVIRRLPRYYRYLGELLESGVERISSNDLSKRMKVTASQIRQDLNNFGGLDSKGTVTMLSICIQRLVRFLDWRTIIILLLSAPVIWGRHWLIMAVLKREALF